MKLCTTVKVKSDNFGASKMTIFVNYIPEQSEWKSFIWRLFVITFGKTVMGHLYEA
jgi:hypothetical protein